MLGALAARTRFGASTEHLDPRAVLRVAHRHVLDEKIRDDVGFAGILYCATHQLCHSSHGHDALTCPRLPTEIPCDPLHHKFETMTSVAFGFSAAASSIIGKRRGRRKGRTNTIVVIVNRGICDGHLRGAIDVPSV